MAKSTATVDLIANDSRFRGAMKRVSSTMERVRERMMAVSRAARRTLLVGAAAVAGFLKLAADQIREETKLEAVLKATGNAAGFTATQLKRQASELQSLTGIGDEAIIGLQAILATFKEIKGIQFTRVTKAALDMSAVLGQDLKGAAIQLGKALNDPIKGLTALSRSGVTFSKAQETVIKDLVKSGRIMTAQSKILDELESQFGGAAKAIGDTFVGSMKKAFAALGDVGEKIGNVFIPIVKSLADQVLPLLERTGEWIEKNQKLVLSIAVVVGSVTTLLAVTGPLLIVLGLLPIAFVKAAVAIKGLTLALAFLGKTPIVIVLTLIGTALGVLAAKFLTTKGKASEFNEELDKTNERLANLRKLHATPIAKAEAVLEGLIERERRIAKRLEKARQQLRAKGIPLSVAPPEVQRRVFMDTTSRESLIVAIVRQRQEVKRLREAMKEEKESALVGVELLKRQKAAREQVGTVIRKIADEIRILNASTQEEQDAIRLRIQLERELDRLIATGANALQLAQVVDSQKELNRLKAQQVALQATQKETDALKAQARHIRAIVKTDKERLAEELKLVAVLEQAGLLTSTEVARRTAMLQGAQTERGISGRIEGLTATFRRIQEAAAGREPLAVAKATNKNIEKLNDIVTLIKDAIIDAIRQGPAAAIFGT